MGKQAPRSLLIQIYPRVRVQEAGPQQLWHQPCVRQGGKNAFVFQAIAVNNNRCHSEPGTLPMNAADWGSWKGQRIVGNTVFKSRKRGLPGLPGDSCKFKKVL